MCDDGFTLTTASVACRQLGYPAAISFGNYFGNGKGKIWLDDVVCQGNEKFLANCSHRDWNLHGCSHTEDVGVICQEGTLLSFFILY